MKDYGKVHQVKVIANKKVAHNTVMVKNIGTPALLPENCCNYKFIGIHMFIYFALEKHNKSEKKSHICYHCTQNSKNGLDKIIGTFSKL